MAMISCITLINYLDNLLNSAQFRDYCPNGLQIEGRAELSTVVSGVSASDALIDAAIDRGADALLVHHGYFWRGEEANIAGMRRRRIAKLLANDINLIAYHLPLDAHQLYGNNAQLAQRLNIVINQYIDVDGQPGLFVIGELATAMPADDFAQWISTQLSRPPLHLAGDERLIKRVALCTGGAQRYLQLAIDHQVDAYITGEASEPCFHMAQESGVHFYAAGHHATERYGVQALGEHLVERYGIRHEYVELDNPV